MDIEPNRATSRSTPASCHAPYLVADLMVFFGTRSVDLDYSRAFQRWVSRPLILTLRT